MIDVLINNTKWECPTSWSEMSIERTKMLANIVKKYATEQTLEFECEVMTLMCGMPPKICAKIEPRQREEFVEKYLSKFILSVVAEPIFSLREIDRFEWHGEWLEIPKSKSKLVAQTKYCARTTAEEFCLASDLYIADKIDNAAMIVATLCRVEGEEYSQTKSEQRAETLSKLPMSIVWEVFYALQQTHKQIRESYPACYIARAEQNMEQKKTLSWSEMPIIIGRCLPSEVERAKKMNCYELAKLVDAGIRMAII